MEDRLSPLSYDSGLHSLSAPSSPQKLFEGQRTVTATKPTTVEEEPTAKRPRLEDARVPASRESSEEALSSDDTGIDLQEDDTKPFCEPSTSKQSPRRQRQEEKDCLTEEDESTLDHSDKPTTSKDSGTHKCLWDECEHQGTSAHTLYDHVMEIHIQEVVNRTEGEEEELECLWGDCPMSIVRGEWSKKVKWLEEHYRTRHAKNALTVKCVVDDCKFRCSTYGKLEDHIRCTHMKEKTEVEPVEEAKQKRQEEEQPEEEPRGSLMQDEYLFDPYYENIILERNKRAAELNYQCEWRLRKRPEAGAKHRKVRVPYIGEWVPSSPKREAPPPAAGVQETDFSLTLEDLFPGWDYKRPAPPARPPPKVARPNRPPTPVQAPSPSLDHDIPILERISPCPLLEKAGDCPPPLLPQTSSSSSDSDDIQNCDSYSLPSLDRYCSDIECSKA